MPRARRIRERPCRFIDASYFIALLHTSDALHARATHISAKLMEQRVCFVTTHAILLEVGSAFSHPTLRPLAVRAFSWAARNPDVAVVPLSAALYERAVALFRDRPDQGWSLTDCISFTVMADLSIDAALTRDRHFEQAGFHALLRSLH